MNTERNTNTAVRWAACEAAEQKLKEGQQPKSTPLPWHISRLDEDEHMIRDAEQADIAVLVGATEHDAKLIIASVNHAEKLAEALREIVGHPYWRGISIKATEALHFYDNERQ